MEAIVREWIDPEFNADERLYHRLREGDCSCDVVLNTAIRLPSLSVNRSKYSKPEDVLDPDKPEFNRISEISVADLPDDYQSSGNKTTATYSFGVEHVPFKSNIAHSEIRVSKDGIFKENRTFSAGVKKVLRQRLVKKMTVHPRHQDL